MSTKDPYLDWLDDEIMKTSGRLGIHMDISSAFLKLVGNQVDSMLNGGSKEKPTGFVLFLFPPDHSVLLLDYLTNVSDTKILNVLKEMVARLESEAVETKPAN